MWHNWNWFNFNSGTAIWWEFLIDFRKSVIFIVTWINVRLLFKCVFWWRLLLLLMIFAVAAACTTAVFTAILFAFLRLPRFILRTTIWAYALRFFTFLSLWNLTAFIWWGALFLTFRLQFFLFEGVLFFKNWWFFHFI